MDQAEAVQFGTALLLLIAAWVMIDAAKRGADGLTTFLWGLGTFLLLCVVFPLWLFVRPAVPGDPVRPAKLIRRGLRRSRTGGWNETDPTRCPACGSRITPEDSICPSCGINFGLSGEELLSPSGPREEEPT